MPPTERRGRIHTSTVTVSVLAEAARVQSGLDPGDLRIRWFSGTGPGGQHRNKHMNSVELIHAPTGLMRRAQTRSRDTSMREAMAALEQDVAQLLGNTASRATNAERSAQIGLGMRGDKRRTYRFRDDRVVDDLTGLSARCTHVMRGRIDLLWPEADRPKA